MRHSKQTYPHFLFCEYSCTSDSKLTNVCCVRQLSRLASASVVPVQHTVNSWKSENCNVFSLNNASKSMFAVSKTLVRQIGEKETSGCQACSPRLLVSLKHALNRGRKPPAVYLVTETRAPTGLQGEPQRCSYTTTKFYKQLQKFSLLEAGNHSMTIVMETLSVSDWTSGTFE